MILADCLRRVAWASAQVYQRDDLVAHPPRRAVGQVTLAVCLSRVPHHLGPDTGVGVGFKPTLGQV